MTRLWKDLDEVIHDWYKQWQRRGVFEKIFPIICDLGHGINVTFVFKSHNTTFSPINLGYVSSSESADDIIADAKRIHDCFEDPSISFFYHYHLFEDEELGEKSLNNIIDSLKDMGYEFLLPHKS